jgi:O-antigen ligase
VRTTAGRVEVQQPLALGLAVAALAALTAGVGFGVDGAMAVAALSAAGVALLAARLQWEHALAALILMILWIPIKRFVLPASLPFQLEPYRMFVALLIGVWVLALLVDPRIRLRRSGLEGPIFLILVAALASVVVNPARVAELDGTVTKLLTFLISFLLVFYAIVSLVTPRAVEFLVKTLVIGGAVVSVTAIIEYRTGFNPHLSVLRLIPFFQEVGGELGDSSRRRAYASAQHPIALGVALTMLIPFALCLARASRSRWWWGAVALLLVGALTTQSRTAFFALVAVGIVFVVLRTREAMRLWPVLIPIAVATHFVAPGALGAVRATFLSPQDLIAEQQTVFVPPSDVPTWCNTAGRVADLGPALSDVSHKPLLGYGYGTRVVGAGSQEVANACVLDNQWLATLLETGTIGAIAWLWLFLLFVRQGGRFARAHASSDGWLVVASVASVSSFAVSMLFFDAYSFIQVTFLLFITLAIGAAVMRLQKEARVAPLPVALSPSPQRV